MSSSVQQLNSKVFISPANIKKFEKDFGKELSKFLWWYDWGVYIKESGISIYMSSDKINTAGLDKIAPYVKSGSYLEFQSENGQLFRYVFKNKMVYYVAPKIVWPKV